MLNTTEKQEKCGAWMYNLCIGHTPSPRSFCVMCDAENFSGARRWTIFMGVAITELGGNCSEFHTGRGKRWHFYIAQEDCLSTHFAISYLKNVSM